MLAQLLIVVFSVFGVMTAWFVLQSLTRRVCRSDSNSDVFEGLTRGCGVCHAEPMCQGRKHCDPGH